MVGHISEAAHAHHSGQKGQLIVNCTGLSAGKLGGVEDKSMVPARGQTVLVRNEAVGIVGGSGTNDADEVCYVIPRAAGKILNPLHQSISNNDMEGCRRRHHPRRLLPGGQLGLPIRPEHGK